MVTILQHIHTVIILDKSTKIKRQLFSLDQHKTLYFFQYLAIRGIATKHYCSQSSGVLAVLSAVVLVANRFYKDTVRTKFRQYSRTSMVQTLMAGFELFLETLGTNPIAADSGIIYDDFLFYIDKRYIVCTH